MSDDQLFFNGVDAESGEYLTPPIRVRDLAAMIRLEGPASGGVAAHLAELRRRHQSEDDHLGVLFGDPDDIRSAAWGLIVPHDLNGAVLDALEPLLRLRREQAGERYKLLTVEPGESKERFLRRHGMGPSVADPRKVPYYLLIVGGPDKISFSFQYELDVSYAVGRVDFDTPDQYASYAASVVAAEAGGDSPPRRAHFFGVRNAGDTPTALSSSRLVGPLRDDLRELSDWQIGDDVGGSATKSRLYELLVGTEAPPVLFTASHGLGTSGTRQRDVQGALLCQNWPGPLKKRGAIREEHYLAGHDISGETPVRTRIVFAFACFSGGTPDVTEFPNAASAERPVLAEHSFVARLPQQLLGNPAGGALAFVGHVDRAWSYSFLWQGVDPQVTSFTGTLLALFNGSRLGNALEAMNARYAELSTMVTSRIDQSRRSLKVVDEADLLRLWTANNDARSYVVLGDPAVRICQPRHGQAAPV
jgi:hypothetical protein